jgi:hypothetical protein
MQFELFIAQFKITHIIKKTGLFGCVTHKTRLQVLLPDLSLLDTAGIIFPTRNLRALSLFCFHVAAFLPCAVPGLPVKFSIDLILIRSTIFLT